MLNRIKEYLDYRGMSVASFERAIGMANASFGKSLKTGGTIGADKIEKILRKFPEINPIWLITGDGDMIIDTMSIVSEPSAQYGRPPEDRRLQMKIIELQEQRIKDLDEIYRLKSIINELTSKNNSSQS
jgi:hypothetical protein